MRRPGDVSLDDFYQDFLKKNPEQNLTKSKYRQVVKDLFETIGVEMIESNFEYRFPKQLGYLRIIRKKRNIKIYNGKKYGMPKVDWAATRKYWAENPSAKERGLVIRHMNNHTNGYYYRYYYDKKPARYRNSGIYGFVIIRKFKRHLAACLKDDSKHIDFFEN